MKKPQHVIHALLMKHPLLIPFLFMAIALLSCVGKGKEFTYNNGVPKHQLWDQLLKKHVDSVGHVSYTGFRADSTLLNQYLTLLSNNPPNPSTWSKEEQLAYWINAYNAFTVKLIVDNYPVSSIRDLHPAFYVPLLNTVWHIKFISIGGKKFSLDKIEHDILRKQFSEPRIHFAIVCASYSCPPLRNEAYVAERIGEQLEIQTITFVNDPKWNRISEESVALSSIFKWFKEDFTTDGSLIEFLNQYTHSKIAENASIDYMDYNWSLNE